GGVAPSIREERECSRLEHAYAPLDPVAAAVKARSAGAVAKLVALDAQRELELERLDRRVERVAHPDVDAGRTGPGTARALAAADRLVVGPVGAPDDHVVHRPLPFGGKVDRLRERSQNDVGEPLARLHVAGDDGRGALRVDK